MTPEPGHRTRKRYNETRPLTIRVGAIRDELDARSDGTEAGYRAVIMRDLKRWYNLMAERLPVKGEIGTVYLKGWYDCVVDPDCEFGDLIRIIEDDMDKVPDWMEYAAIVDALERAKVLTEHAGLSVDDALIAVGLVADPSK